MLFTPSRRLKRVRRPPCLEEIALPLRGKSGNQSQIGSRPPTAAIPPAQTRFGVPASRAGSLPRRSSRTAPPLKARLTLRHCEALRSHDQRDSCLERPGCGAIPGKRRCTRRMAAAHIGRSGASKCGSRNQAASGRFRGGSVRQGPGSMKRPKKASELTGEPGGRLRFPRLPPLHPPSRRMRREMSERSGYESQFCGQVLRSSNHP